MKQIGKILKDRCRNNKGFTLIEIIAVLIIIAIVAAVVLSRGTSTAEVDLKAKAEVIKGHIRFVQMRAMNADVSAGAPLGCKSSFGISIGANNYFLFRDCLKSQPVILPGADSTVVSVPGMNLVPSDVTFDSWGRPCTDAGLLGTPSAGNDIDLGQGIVIKKNTGFVQ